MYRPTLALPWVFATAILMAGVSMLVATKDLWAISQGTATSGEEAEDTSRKQVPAYSMIVDNSDAERFAAPGWATETSGADQYGKDYRVGALSRGARYARFEMEIPATDEYSVYAWWVASDQNNPATRFEVSTASGLRWARVNQRKDGGYWVKIGEHRMKEGTRLVRVAPGLGKPGDAVADAVAVVRGDQAGPPDESYESNLQWTTGDRTFYSTSDDRVERWRVVRVARRHLGTPYGHSRCRRDVREDCSCHTRLVYKRFGRNLPDSPRRQWRYGWKVSRSNLHKGDLVFFKERGRDYPITHVAIYAGNGYVIHASNYFNKVVESKMKYIDGYFGAKRLKLYSN